MQRNADGRLSMKPFDPEGRQGPSKNLPDVVTLVE